MLGTIETADSPIAPLDEKDLEFFIPANNDTYIDLDIKLSVRGKLISVSGNDVDVTDLTVVKNNFHPPLLCQYNITHNGVTITQASEQ